MLFGIIGVFGLGVNMALLFLLASVGANHLIAAAAASEVSLLGNFFLNDRWTFSDAGATSPRLQRAFQYNVVALGGMGLQIAILAVLAMGAGMHYLIANLLGIAVATLSNYALNSRFTWRPGSGRTLSAATIPVRVES
jgi:dolichol-phosphate mannosyltransferase